jgi:hypothetical protein
VSGTFRRGGDGRACQDAAAAGELEVLADFVSDDVELDEDFDEDFDSDFDSDFDDEPSDELPDESELEEPAGTAPARLSVR